MLCHRAFQDDGDAIQCYAAVVQRDGAAGAPQAEHFACLQQNDARTLANGLAGLQLGVPFDGLLLVATDAHPVVGHGLVAAVVAHLFGAILVGVEGVVAADSQELVLTDGVAAVLDNTDLLVIAHGLLAVVGNGDGLVVLDLLGAVVADAGGLVVVDVDVLVLLRVDVDLLLILLVLKAQLVVAFALVGLTLDGHPRLVPRQLIGRQLQAVIDPSGDHRLVWITVVVGDDHLLADTRDGHVAPGGTGDVLRDADPAGAVLVLLALAIPRELDLHPTVFVGVDLFVGRPDNDGVLRPVDARLGQRFGAPLGVVRHQFGLVVVEGALLRLGAFLGLAGVLRAAVDDAHRAPAAVHVFTGVTSEGEGDARLQARVIALDQGNARIAPVAAQAVLGEGPAGLVELGPGG